MEYRERSSGDLISKSEARKRNPNISLPKIWNDNIFEVLGVDPVFETPRPTPSGAYKEVVRDGVEQDSDNNWVQKWVERDMFSDNDDETKSEQEAAYQAILDTKKALNVRTRRNKLLQETDWLGLSDVTMSTEWATYRQALRDVPAQSGFPNDVTWPTEP